jgi:hypothetical protein
LPDAAAKPSGCGEQMSNALCDEGYVCCVAAAVGGGGAPEASDAAAAATLDAHTATTDAPAAMSGG